MGNTIEQRWTNEGEMSWCIITSDKIIGFGPGEESREICLKRVNDKDLYKYTHCADYTLKSAPLPPEKASTFERLTAAQWRNEAFEACAVIAERYEQPFAAADMRAMKSATPIPKEVPPEKALDWHGQNPTVEFVSETPYPWEVPPEKAATGIQIIPMNAKAVGLPPTEMRTLLELYMRRCPRCDGYDTPVCDLCTQTAALLNAPAHPPQAVGGWIRIEDGCEVPEDYEAVLVSGYDYGDKNMGRWINKSQFRNGRFRDVDYADHWARIVPPPLPTMEEKS